MQTHTTESLLRSVLAHSLATLILCCSIAYGAGFALGSVIHWLNGRLSAVASARLAPANPQLMATIEAWQEEVKAGRWIEPQPIDTGSWRDLQPQSEQQEADQDLPLSWAV